MHRAIVWIASAFAAGIALGRWAALSVLAWAVLAGVFLAAAVVSYAAGRPAAAPLLLATIATGAVWYTFHVLPPGETSLAALAGREVVVMGTVARPPQVSRGRTRAVVTVDNVSQPSGTSSSSGRVVITLPGELPLRYGDRISARGRLVRPPPAGNPGEFSYRDYLATQGVDAVVYARADGGVRRMGRGRANPILAAAYALRERLLDFFQRAMPGPRGALMASLLLGDDGAIGADVRDAFRRSGLLHVLVVSGAQVGLVLGSLLWLGRALRAPPLAGAAAAGTAVVFFALMAGWVPSVARAAVMAVVGVAAMAWRRDRDPYAALAVAALALLAAMPRLLFDAGFQLSFVATWALLYVAPAVAERLPAHPRPVRSLVSLTVAAQLSVMPLLAHHFLQVSLAGFIANLAALPVVAVLVPAGFVAAFLGLVVPGAAGIIALPLVPLVDGVLLTARIFAHLPGAAVPVPAPSAVGFAGCYLALVVAVEWARGHLRVSRRHVGIASAAVLAVAVWLQVAAAAALPRLTITFLDVGQGDAIVIRAPSGRTLLIDGGGEVEGRATGYDVGAQRVVPALRRLGVREIDVIILTHPHEDHVGGLVAVAQNFRVGLVLDSGFPHPAPSYGQFLHLVEERKIPYQLARRGMRLDLGSGAGLVVLHPEDPLIRGSGSDVNLNSVVARMAYGEVSVLLTGDIEGLVESRLLEYGDELRSTVLKVAHHGSATSTTPAFLDAVAPAVAVISVGAFNPFGHPHRATLEALAAAGVLVYRTDRDGAVTMHTDGRRMWVSTVRDAGDR